MQRVCGVSPSQPAGKAPRPAFEQGVVSRDRAARLAGLLEGDDGSRVACLARGRGNAIGRNGNYRPVFFPLSIFFRKS